MNNQNMNNFMPSGMMNNQAFYNGGDEQNNNVMDEKQFLESIRTGPQGGVPIKNLKSALN